MKRNTATRFAACLLATHALAAQAATGTDETPRGPTAEMLDIDAPRAITRMTEAGGISVYLGMQGRDRVYLLATKDGRTTQIAYVDPSTERTTYGEAFGRDGSSDARRHLEAAIGRYEAILAGRSPDSPLGIDVTQDKPEALTAEAGPPEATPDERAPATSRPRMERPAFLANVANSLTTFHVGNPTATKVYLVTSPKCDACYDTWAKLRPLATQGKADVVIVLAAPTKEEEPLTASILSLPKTSLSWYSGVGSTPDASLVPAPPAPNTPARKQIDAYVRMNTMFAHDLGGTLPIVAYEDSNGGWHVENGPDVERVGSDIAKRNLVRNQTGY